MPPGPAPADPGRDDTWPGTPSGPGQDPPPGDPGPAEWEPVITRPDPMTEEEREAWLDALAGEAEALDPEEYPDPEGPPPPDEDELTAEEIAGNRGISPRRGAGRWGCGPVGDDRGAGRDRRCTGAADQAARSARVFPGESSAARRRSAAGWLWT